MLGMESEITVRVGCDNCQGTGDEAILVGEKWDHEICSRCDGTGRLVESVTMQEIFDLFQCHYNDLGEPK